MPKYQVLIHVTGLVILDDRGRRTTGGAYAWRGIAAPDETAAGPKAFNVLLAEPEFVESVWNDHDNPPRFTVEEIVFLDGDATLAAYDSGIVYYDEDKDAIPPDSVRIRGEIRRIPGRESW